MYVKKEVTILFITACLITLGFVASASAYDIKWGTSPAGGIWQALGTAMTEDVVKSNPSYKGSTMPIGGAANVIAVHQGKINVGFSFSSTAGEGWDGKEFFKKHGQMRNIRELALLFPEPTQIAVWKNSPINDISQLKGKKITAGPKGGAIRVVSRYVLEAYGLSFNDVDVRFMSFSEAGKQFIDGHIDCIFYGAMAFPAPPLVNASSRRPIKLLPLSEKVIKFLVTEYKGLDPYTLPKKCYPGVDEPVPGIVASVVAIASKDMPDQVAYDIVKSIDKNFDRYGSMIKAMSLGKREDMAKDIGIPMHPGAAKYYRERGWLK